MNDFVLSGLIIGILAMIFFTPGMMCKGISKMLYGDDEPGGSKLLNWVPFLNMIRAEKIYYGKLHLVSIATLLLLVMFPTRILVWRFMYSNTTLGLITYFGLFAVAGFFILANMIFVFNVLHDADVMYGVKLGVFAVLYPFGQYWIGAYLNNVIKHINNEKETFDG